MSVRHIVTVNGRRIDVDDRDAGAINALVTEVANLRAENERLRARLRVIRRTVESERGRNLDADRVIDRVAAWVDEALEGNEQ